MIFEILIMSTVVRIPFEIWETILDKFDRQDLLNFQTVCQEWYYVSIRYVMSGRLKNRAVVSIKVGIVDDITF